MNSLKSLRMTRTNKAFKTEEDVRKCYKSLQEATREKFNEYGESVRNAINYAKEKVLY